MKFADVHRFWVSKRTAQDEKPTISPLVQGEDGRLFVDHEYIHMGKQPPLGIVVGEWWWDEAGVLQLDLLPEFDEIRKSYGV